RIIKTLNRFIFRNTSVICLSGITAKDVLGIYEGEPHILNNGIDVVDLEFGKKENKIPVILFFSNLFIAKGVFDFLETLAILRDSGVKFTGLIYGQEGDVSKQQLDLAIRDMALYNHVSYGGEVSGPEKYEIFQKSDILFFPTHIENFPGVVLEAMQLSLPVVSVYVGSIPEIVIDGETGYLYQSGNNIEAADKVGELVLNTDLREKMGIEGKKRFFNKYTLVIFKENLLKIINSEVRP
ncbi:MAG: glycosyltransferase family 4 protein, partial [Candidatus Heimdallarchaeota archaeon]|nr:glycosyltransferase family 4 protein [Candidatus Heimdallarchaeota archaeon]